MWACLLFSVVPSDLRMQFPGHEYFLSVHCLFLCGDFTALLGLLMVFKIYLVHPLQVELGELKGRLTEVISNCDALCKRISAEGPESLQSSIRPFTAVSSDQKTSSVFPSSDSTGETEDQSPQQTS